MKRSTEQDSDYEAERSAVVAEIERKFEATASESERAIVAILRGAVADAFEEANNEIEDES